MKPTILSLFLLISSFGLSASAQDSRQMDSERKTIRLQGVYTSISVEDNMTVILTDGPSDKIMVEGDVKTVDVRIHDGCLTLATRHPSAAELKIYVPASYVTKIFMNAKGMLSSASILRNSKMKIFLAAEAKIDVRSIGKVTIETTDDIQFVNGR